MSIISMTGPASSKPASLPIIDMVVVATLALEVFVVALMMAGGWLGHAAIVHVGVIGTLLTMIVLMDASGIETGNLQLYTLLLSMGGPVGAAAALISDHMSRNLDPGELAKWHETIAPNRTRAVTITDLILDRRVVGSQSQLPRSYEESLLHGSIEEQQALLGYLATQNDMEVVNAALALALRSPEPRIRVQAAAVSAHLREKQRSLAAQTDIETLH